MSCVVCHIYYCFVISGTILFISYFQGPYNLEISKFDICDNRTNEIDVVFDLKKVGNDYILNGNLTSNKIKPVEKVRFCIVFCENFFLLLIRF